MTNECHKEKELTQKTALEKPLQMAIKSAIRKPPMERKWW